LEYRGRGVSEVAVVGRACRLPGAGSVARLWDLLRHERCAVRQIPDDRWSLERFGHPRRGEPGRSYTWSAGVLDDIWGFDAAAFGISPREAEQMDPQQRLLLELVQEALDDAGIAASTLAGKDVGVFVGASSLDHGNAKLFDIAAGDAYFATGNALSLIANRISYIYDLHGPSMTIDTACSSSLVALHQATSAIRSGQIKTAIVAGVNILASPFSFIGFSQASMLSATGLCHSFGDGADGYVRAEGGVVLVLRALPEALAARNEIHALVLATGTNSDGRTTGVAFPSAAAQAGLLSRVYADHHIDPDDLAFVEAHGTGTRVGDPAEARAMGESLGKKRQRPLPIGSIKSNIGHLEPASGLAGVLKSMLALEHNMLPPSLHCDVPNRDIPFDELNLVVNTRPRPLSHGRDMLAGVSSFGFGGTNAHAVIGRAPIQLPPGGSAVDYGRRDQIVLLSAHSAAALADLSESFAEQIVDADESGLRRTVAALAHRRDRAAFRAAILADDRDEIVAGLGDIVNDDAHANPMVVLGRAIEPHAKTTFVYSGNGSQWSGMGRIAFAHNAAFRDSFRKIDAVFAPLAGWKLEDRLFSPDLDQQLPMTSIAQPLIFAIQGAITETLAGMGLRPDVVLGHSVGEIAAAYASGILPIESAVRVVQARSRHQELARLKGRMAVVFAGEEATRALLEDHPDVEIAAFNSPGAFTVSGGESAIERMAAAAAATGIKTHVLDLDYPFHCNAMDVVRAPLLADLAELHFEAASTPFVSTVDPDDENPSLDAGYWWRNVREPVQFSRGLRRAAALGARIFIEIGPRSTLLRHIVDTFSPIGTRIACVGSLERGDAKDPFRRVLASALVRGARVSSEDIAGPDPGPGIALPAYPWQHKAFRLADTGESFAFLNPQRVHPLIGSRLRPDANEWHHHIDTLRFPELADHVVGKTVILPGAAFLEMMWAASMEWRGTNSTMIADVEIVQPLVLNDGISVEVRTKITPETGAMEIASRPRLSTAPWTLHAKGKSIDAVGPGRLPPLLAGVPEAVFEARDIYAKAQNVGLDYGPAFQKVARTVRYAEDQLAVELIASADSPAFGMAPWQLDACFHGIVSLFEKGRRKNDAFIPVRFGDSRLERPGRAIARAEIAIKASDDRKMIADFVLYDAENNVIAVLRDARFQVRPDDARPDLHQKWILTQASLPLLGEGPPVLADVAFGDILSGLRMSGPPDPDAPDNGSYSLLLEGWATALTMRLAASVARSGSIDIGQLLAEGHIGPKAAPWLPRLMEGLEACQLARHTDDGYMLMPDPSLPSDSDVLHAIAVEYPQYPAELLAAGQLAQAVSRIEAEDRHLFENGPEFNNEALAEYGACAQRCAGSVTQMLDNVVSRVPAGKALRILLIGTGPAFLPVCERAKAHGAMLSILETDPRRLEKARLSSVSPAQTRFAASVEDLGARHFDLILSAGSIGDFAGAQQSMLPLQALLTPGGLLVAAEPLPSLFADLVEGPGATSAGHAIRSDAWWRLMLSTFAEHDVRRADAGDGEVRLLLARASGDQAVPTIASGTAVVLSRNPASDLAKTVEQQLSERGYATTLTHPSRDDAVRPCDHLVFIDDAFIGDADPPNPVARTTARIANLTKLIALRAAVPGRLCIPTFGAYSHRDTTEIASETAVTAFLRTAANEYPKAAFQQVDLPPDAPHDVAARLIADVVSCNSDETELILDPAQTRAARIAPLEAARTGSSGHLRLVREHGAGGLDRLTWVDMELGDPEPDQVTIEVRATGVNFRDLMSAMSLLPDTILEHGYAGPTMGLECAGVVSRIGERVTGFAVGDRVVAMSRNGFATEVIVPASGVRHLPENMSFEAGASIPVAFATAYYGLVTLARIGDGDTVLIHGGAGGVGLAALQIAKSRGAIVIASAGSPAKRDLLLSLGADHVVNSRALSFADEVRTICPAGVQIILNSVAGEAMERSIALLQPFGHFIELGKRDYVANTHIGLAPFGRNLTYHGVDLDQLVIHRPAVFAAVLDAVMEDLRSGVLSPIPYRVFAAKEAGEAFRVMQKSGHVGKLVVTPPPHAAEPQKSERRSFDAGGTHMVTGGLGGFGLKTAVWLADQGVKSIVVVGRNAPGAEASTVLEALGAAGVTVRVAACDVSDEDALRSLLEQIRAEMPPLRGVYHAAMVLRDATIANIDEEGLRATLAPKLGGARALDRLTRTDDLSYFVLFSSATTFFGNPGQAAYVAANGCLEGLARRRRREGLPGLAIAWGAISDVGVLANNEPLRQALLDRVGVQAFSSAQALDALADVLASDDRDVDAAVVAIAPINWAAARGRLSILKSPTFATVSHNGTAPSADEDGRTDLRAVYAESGRDAALKVARTAIIDVISRVLRLPTDEVDTQRPLAEMGIDSLVSIELAMQIENSLGEKLQFTASVGALSLARLAIQIVDQLGAAPDDAENESTVAAMAARHISPAPAPAGRDAAPARAGAPAEAGTASTAETSP